jgi:hypothetical protein
LLLLLEVLLLAFSCRVLEDFSCGLRRQQSSPTSRLSSYLVPDILQQLPDNDSTQSTPKRNKADSVDIHGGIENKDEATSVGEEQNTRLRRDYVKAASGCTAMTVRFVATL